MFVGVYTRSDGINIYTTRSHNIDNLAFHMILSKLHVTFANFEHQI